MRQAILGFVLLAATSVPATAQLQRSAFAAERRPLTTAVEGEGRLRQDSAVAPAMVRIGTGRPSQFARWAAAAPVITTTTPFVRHTRVRIASFSGRRIEIAAFKSTQPMGNLLHGLPGGGSPPAWGRGWRIEAGAATPRGSENFGLQLNVAIGRLSGGAEGIDAWRCLAKIVGLRGCHLD